MVIKKKKKANISHPLGKHQEDTRGWGERVRGRGRGVGGSLRQGDPGVFLQAQTWGWEERAAGTPGEDEEEWRDGLWAGAQRGWELAGGAVVGWKESQVGQGWGYVLGSKCDRVCGVLSREASGLIYVLWGCLWQLGEEAVGGTEEPALHLMGQC